MRRLVTATVAVAVLSAGCSSSSTAGSSAGSPAGGRPVLSVSGAYVPRPPLTDMAAGYLTVRNTGRVADRLTAVTSDLASDVTMMTTGPDGSMRAVGELAVPAGGRLTLRVGGDHLMLMGLRDRPAVGRRVSFELRFATSSPITVRAPVEPASYRPGG